MGRTVPSITQAFLQEQESFTRFRRAAQTPFNLVYAARHNKPPLFPFEMNLRRF